MTYTTRRAGLCAIITALAAPVSAQQVPVRDITTIDAKSPYSFGNIFGVRQLAGGGVLVNDGVRRQLVTLDASLKGRKVVIDSVNDGGNSYGPRPAPIIPYLGDSTLFVDGASLTLLVLDPSAKVTHVMAAPKPSDMRFLAGSASGIDNNGNLVYEGIIQINRRGVQPGVVTQAPDSAPIVRANFEARTLDTIGRVNVGDGSGLSVVRGADGRVSVTRTINPVQTIDEWAVLSDGSIAFVRGQDYHIDWIRPDGSKFSSPKLPFDWKRITDEAKQGLLDSAKTAIEREAEQARTTGGAGAAGGAATAVGGVSTEFRVSAGARDGGSASMNPGSPVPPQQSFGPPTPTIEYVPLSKIPDYYPPIRGGAAVPDLDGNLWILPTTSAQSRAGELVYDVVNNQGQLTHRVRLPAGRSVAGFGKKGVVYLMSREASGTWSLEQAVLR